MLDFVNTGIIKENSTIKIGILTSQLSGFQKAYELFHKLIDGEELIDLFSHRDGLKARVKKNGFDITVETMPMSDASRGHKIHYAFICSSILDLESGKDFYFNRLQTMVVNYNVKDEYVLDYIPRIMLY